MLMGLKCLLCDALLVVFHQGLAALANCVYLVDAIYISEAHGALKNEDMVVL